jgi:cytochrome c oxidase subunit III
VPGTVADELDLHLERGFGGGTPPGGNAGGDDGGRGGGRSIPRRAYITGITLAVAAIMMFFMALTSSFIVRKGTGTDWQAFGMPRVLWANTVILLLSSLTLEMARRQLARGVMSAFRNLWALTTGLGLLFVGGQLVAWHQLRAAGVYLSTNPSSSFFYVFTAAHAVHVLGGIFALLFVAFRSWQRSRTTQAIGAEVAGIYWHFLDGLWVFLLLLLSLGR